MNFAGLLYLLAAHYLTGKGALRLFKLQPEPIQDACFAMMTGVPLLALTPCFLQLLKIPITASAVGIAIALVTGLFCIPLVLNFSMPRFQKFAVPKLYEWPALALFLFFIVISVWRCFFMPPYSNDMLTGPELIADYAIREKTMINSVFSLDLHATNNYFKSPYITGLQIIYKLLVYPFGQLWLSILFISFSTWLYTLLRARVHPLLAGILMLLFIAVPEVYAYTFMLLYDYSNMVFFFSGFYFLVQYMGHNRLSDFAFSAFLFGLATYIRTESLILIAMISPLLILYCRRQRLPLKTTALRMLIFIGVPAAFYFLCIKVFVRLFVPLHLDIAHEINSDPGNFAPFFQRLSDMATVLIFSDDGLVYYAGFIYFFCGLLLADIILVRRFNKEALYALYGVAVIYFGIGFIGYLLPLADLQNTTKRGLFKIIPIMVLYMCNSGLVLRLSESIKRWESGDKREKKPVPAGIPPGKREVINKPQKRSR